MTGPRLGMLLVLAVGLAAGCGPGTEARPQADPSALRRVAQGELADGACRDHPLRGRTVFNETGGQALAPAPRLPPNAAMRHSAALRVRPAPLC